MKPYFLLDCTDESRLPAVTKSFTKSAIDATAYLKLPSYVDREFVLYQVEQLEPDIADVDISAYVKDCCCNNSWLDISVDGLNLHQGYHKYRVCFINKFTNETYSLFFAYIINDDHPDKDYIYMSR